MLLFKGSKGGQTKCCETKTLCISAKSEAAIMSPLDSPKLEASCLSGQETCLSPIFFAMAVIHLSTWNRQSYLHSYNVAVRLLFLLMTCYGSIYNILSHKQMLGKGLQGEMQKSFLTSWHPRSSCQSRVFAMTVLSLGWLYVKNCRQLQATIVFTIQNGKSLKIFPQTNSRILTRNCAQMCPTKHSDAASALSRTMFSPNMEAIPPCQAPVTQQNRRKLQNI